MSRSLSLRRYSLSVSHCHPWRDECAHSTPVRRKLGKIRVYTVFDVLESMEKRLVGKVSSLWKHRFLRFIGAIAEFHSKKSCLFYTCITVCVHTHTLKTLDNFNFTKQNPLSVLIECICECFCVNVGVWGAIVQSAHASHFKHHIYLYTTSCNYNLNVPCVYSAFTVWAAYVFPSFFQWFSSFFFFVRVLVFYAFRVSMFSASCVWLMISFWINLFFFLILLFLDGFLVHESVFNGMFAAAGRFFFYLFAALSFWLIT